MTITLELWQIGVLTLLILSLVGTLSALATRIVLVGNLNWFRHRRNRTAARGTNRPKSSYDGSVSHLYPTEIGANSENATAITPSNVGYIVEPSTHPSAGLGRRRKR